MDVTPWTVVALLPGIFHFAVRVAVRALQMAGRG